MSCCPQNKETRSDSVAFNYRYDRLKDLTKYKCEPTCLCRFDKPRSSFDQLQLKSVLAHKPIDVPAASAKFRKEWGSY